MLRCDGSANPALNILEGVAGTIGGGVADFFVVNGEDATMVGIGAERGPLSILQFDGGIGGTQSTFQKTFAGGCDIGWLVLPRAAGGLFDPGIAGCDPARHGVGPPRI